MPIFKSIMIIFVSFLMGTTAFATQCQQLFAQKSENFQTTSKTLEHNRPIVLFFRDMGLDLSTTENGRLSIQRNGSTIYRTNFSPVTWVQGLQGKSGQVYLLALSLDRLHGITHFDVLAVNSKGVKKIEVAQAPQDLLDAAKKNNSTPALGRVTITKVEELDTTYYYVHYLNSLGEQGGVGITTEHLQALMKAAGVHDMDGLSGYNRIIIAPEAPVGRDMFIDRLSGLK